MNILVVDDEPLIHLSIEKLILASSEDCQVSHAYNGQQMLELLKSQRFQLAYVDIKMPGSPGWRPSGWPRKPLLPHATIL